MKDPRCFCKLMGCPYHNQIVIKKSVIKCSDKWECRYFHKDGIVKHLAPVFKIDDDLSDIKIISALIKHKQVNNI